MKVGDLVRWESQFWKATYNPPAPGIILEVDDSHRQMRYKIMWSDGKVTNEHAGYLLPA